MSDGGALDQREIERLLSGMSGGAAPSPSPPSASSPPPAASPPPVAAKTPSAPVAATPAGDAGVLSQEELNALFGSTSSPPPPPVPPAPRASASPQPASPLPTSPPSSQPPSPAEPALGSGWDVPAGTRGWTPPATASFTPAAEDEEEEIPRGDLDYIAKKAEDSIRSIAATPMNLPTEVIEFQFPEFGGTVPSTEHATLDQISEVDLDVKVELGRTYMYIEDVLKLRRGSVVPLDKMAGETVDIYINGRLLARGEVLVMNENFCVRVAELLAGAIPME